MSRLRRTPILLPLLLVLAFPSAASAQFADNRNNLPGGTQSSIGKAGTANNWAVEIWNPIDGGIFDERIQLRSTHINFYAWMARRLGSPDCSMEPDNVRVSKHDILGYRLGDVCNLPPDVRESITISAKADLAELGKSFLKEKAQRGDRLVGREMVSDDTVNGLRKGTVGWDTKVRNLDQEAEPITFSLVTFYTGPARVYIGTIERTFCAPAIENTLAPSSSFMEALIAKYGRPTHSETKGQKDQQALKEMQAQLDAASRLVDLKENLAVTGKSHAEVARLREKEKEIAAILKAGEAKARGKGDYVIAHRWVYDNYNLVIERIGECENLKPKYQMTMKGRGGKRGLATDLTEDNANRINQLVQESAKSRQSNAPLPKF